MDGDAFTAAEGPQAVVALGLDVDLVRLGRQALRNGLLHGGQMRLHYGTLSYNCSIQVHQPPTVAAYQTRHVPQEVSGVRVLVRRVAGGELPADVAQPRRPQQRVDDGVQQRIAVAVAQEAPVVRDEHAAEHQWTSLDETVDVVAGAYADGSTSAVARDARMASASARSCGVVTFKLP